MSEPASILTEGNNCWRIAHANRVSFLIDARAYFDAFLGAIERAERSIFILSWDIDSQTRLSPQDERHPNLLIDALNRVVARKRDLRVFILNWDYAPIYAFERETASTLRFRLNRHQRIQFVSDTAGPYFASMHQKVVVIDDSVAFTGGLDLTGSRWDTPEHLVVDPRRVNRRGQPYPPFHDVQVAVDDEAARALGAIARERWRRATGRQAISPQLVRGVAPEGSTWPDTLVPDMTDVRIAIARTEPPHEGRPAVREVEKAYLDSIASARRFVYAETQYLTSESVRNAIALRLSEPQGPEIVLVTPRECCGFFEKKTMGIITARLIRDLKSKDRFDRLRVYSPRNGNQEIFVHAKVMIVDDRLARVASSNLSNRSMGVDVECDVIVECDDGSRASEAVRGLRNRLLGEHLGTSPEQVDERIRERGSLIAAIESLLGQERSLYPAKVDADDAELLVSTDFADPRYPVDPQDLLVTGEFRAVRRPMRGTAWVVAVLIAMALAWRFTPLAHLVEPSKIVRFGEQLKGNPLLVPIVIAAYAVLCNLMVPVNLLILATGIVFGPLLGAVLALLGTVSGAASGFLIGRRLGSDAVQRRLGPRAREIQAIIARRGLVAFTIVRFIPIASFGFVNMLAGAMRVRWVHFIVGTLLGMAPGITLATAFGGKVSDMFATSSGPDLWIAVGIGLALLATMSVLLRYVGRRLQRRKASRRRRHSTGAEPSAT
jgi:phosphatidylserine/phosphatidylglycerophosphate/cardiolipin synthase-like enzyme/uncharacterized membrane protein YdjX (TVP38/TMEM64 family)